MKKYVCLVLICSVLLSNIVLGKASDLEGASGWAIKELEAAIENGIVASYDVRFEDYSKNITRELFAGIVINMYYQMAGEYPKPVTINPFLDTSNSDVLRAYSAGIINGKGNGLFAPNEPVSREEMAVMMNRTLNSLNVEYNQGDGVLTIADKDKVASWAVVGVDFAYENDFIKGDGVNFNPQDNTPIDQAVVIINRVFEKYEITEAVEIKDDYSKGYELSNTSNTLYLTYNNTGNKVKISDKVYNTSYDLLKSKDFIYYSKYDDKKIYSYDIKNMRTAELVTLKYSNRDIACVNGGTYDGLIIYNDIYRATDLSDAMETSYIYDTHVNEKEEVIFGYAEPFEDPEGAVAEHYEGFSYQIMNEAGTDYIRRGRGELHTYSNGNVYFSQNQNRVTIRPYNYDAQYETPIVAFNRFDIPYDDYYYSTDIIFEEETGNAGILFELASCGDGQNNFKGFYFGIKPSSDSVMLRKGVGTDEWHNIGNADLNFDVKALESVKLVVKVDGNEIKCYVNGALVLSKYDDSFSKYETTFGLRTFESAASFTNPIVDILD